MRCYTIEELTTALFAAGFSDVKSDHYNSKPWITVIARKWSNMAVRFPEKSQAVELMWMRSSEILHAQYLLTAKEVWQYLLHQITLKRLIAREKVAAHTIQRKHNKYCIVRNGAGAEFYILRQPLRTVLSKLHNRTPLAAIASTARTSFPLWSVIVSKS